MAPAVVYRSRHTYPVIKRRGSCELITATPFLVSGSVKGSNNLAVDSVTLEDFRHRLPYLFVEFHDSFRQEAHCFKGRPKYRPMKHDYYDTHGVQFMEVETNKGSFIIANHDEFRGNYAGFNIQATIEDMVQ